MISEVVLFVKSDRIYDLIEWINYYKKIGFNNIIIYNNESSIEFNTIAKLYPDITINNITGILKQSILMRHHYYNSTADWVYFADLDEFLWFDLKKYKNVNNFITKISKKYKTNVISINWIKIGNYNALLDRKNDIDNTQIKTFKYINPIYEPESWTKLIYKTKLNIQEFNIHKVTPENLIKTVNGNNFSEVKTINYQYHNDEALIFHYFFRSYNEFYFKIFNTYHIEKQIILSKLYNIDKLTYDNYIINNFKQQYIMFTNKIFNVLYK